MLAAPDNIIPSSDEHLFDILIQSRSNPADIRFNNLGELLFKDLDHRKNDDIILIGHVEERYVEITLDQFRSMVASLFKSFGKRGLKSGDTVLLASLESNSELYVAILFMALASYGVEVFLPMYIEKDALSSWYTNVKFDCIIFPEIEVNRLEYHERQKQSVQCLRDFADQVNVPSLDFFDDLELDVLINQPAEIPYNHWKEEIIIIQSVPSNQIALFITTSGTSGASKVVGYNHKSFLTNISAWEKAGFFDPVNLGGRGLTPLFTHTMGIRTFLNAIWLGRAAILINTEWYSEKPEIVSYILKKAEPEHVTGGPAVFNMLLELCRIYPELKHTLRKSLKTIVSSGATFDVELIQKIRAAFDVQVHNAFGSTETQQVLSTILVDEVSKIGNSCLGNTLPGVSIGLNQFDKSRSYKMYIKSEFGGTKIIDNGRSEVVTDNYIYLGDIVKYEGKQLIYKRREKEDIINDEYGMKVPVEKLLLNYKKLVGRFPQLKIFPLKFKPGLAVIILASKRPGLEIKKIEKEIHSIIEQSNNDLFQQLEPLQFNHWTIKRFAIAKTDSLNNWKGILSDHKIKEQLKELIRDLTVDNQPKTNIIEVRSIEEKPSEYFKFHNPYLGRLLKLLQMDASFDTAEGDFLISGDEANRKEILDLAGGYGTNLLGHQHEELRQHAVDFLNSGKIPLSNQLTLQEQSGALAKKLNDLISQHTGNSYYTLFGSTGSEAVEIAIHHAYLEWKKQIKKLYQSQKIQFAHKDESLFKRIWKANWRKIKKARPAIIANKKAFHGTTVSARSLMGDKERRKRFSGLYSISSIFIDDNHPELSERISEVIDDLRIELETFYLDHGQLKLRPFKLSKIIAAIIEPILGEGGIREINPEFPKLLSSYQFPLIIDEIQSGLGRSGTFLASTGYVGNYYLFSKALGGNIEKISSISIEKERYIKKIGKLYVSTFANGALATQVALKNLEIIERDQIPKIARKKGEIILGALRMIAADYPDVIESIDGRGLMIGIRFSKVAIERCLFLRVLYQKKVLGYLFSSYLLNIHKIRILPSISAPHVLRVEPSIQIEEKSIQRLVSGINDLSQIISNGMFYKLTKHLMKGDPFVDSKGYIPKFGSMHQSIDPPAPTAKKVGFLAHFVYPTDELRMLSDDLQNASDTGLRYLFSKFEALMEMKPFVLNARNIYHNKIHLSMLLLPLSSATLEKLHRTNKRKSVVRKIQKSVRLAANQGIKVLSLGGYNSIITNNGQDIIAPEGIKIATGNTLTAVIGYHNFKSEIQNKLSSGNLDIGIIGATGNIGSILAKKFITDDSLHPKGIYLFGKSEDKLDNVRHELENLKARQDISVVVSTDLSRLVDCNAIINTANTNDPIIYPAHLSSEKPTIISDISIPAGVSDEVFSKPNVKIIPFVSSVSLPEDPDFLVTSCSPRGTALCCAAEAILAGFEDITVELRGDITLKGFEIIYELAQKYGFIHNTKSIKSYKTNSNNEVSV